MGSARQLIRALLDSFRLYLPLALMGRMPPTSSNLAILPTEHYHASLVWLSPIVLMAEMLMQAAVVHVVVRLAGRRGNFDQLVSIMGMAALIVGAFILAWDWVWFAIGAVDQHFLGYSHLLLSLWAVMITVIGVKRTLAVPIWPGILLSLLAMPVALPFAITFMRSPM